MEDCGIPDHEIEAEVLVRHTLGLTRHHFFSSLDQPMTNVAHDALDELVQRRLGGEPLAYIVGHREFYGLEFLVNRHVLVPRQETELLVDMVLAHASVRRGRRLDIADIGTGCGAIAVALASNLPQATVYATDISRNSLEVADANCRRHRVADRVHLCEGDLLQALPGPVDVIVSNPPYLSSNELAVLAPELSNEPSIALDGGASGVEVTKRLLEQAPTCVRPGGQVFVEISPRQLESVTQLAQEHFPHGHVDFARDMLGLPRAVSVRVP